MDAYASRVTRLIPTYASRVGLRTDSIIQDNCVYIQYNYMYNCMYIQTTGMATNCMYNCTGMHKQTMATGSNS